MLSVVSVRGGAWPQQPLPVTRPPVVSAIKPSATLDVGSAQAAGASAEPALEGALLARPVSLSTLPPVDPAQQSEQADMYRNAAAPERNGLPPAEALAQPSRGQPQDAAAPDAIAEANGQQPAYPGQLPKPRQTPQEKAEQERIDNFLSNLWQASRTVVDTWQSVASVAAQAATEQASAIRRSEDGADSGEVADTTGTTDAQQAGAAATGRTLVTDRKAALPAMLAGASDKPAPLADLGAAARDAVIRSAAESYTKTQQWPDTDPPLPGTTLNAAI
jgi:hypothetical protein